jgi:hypothetical protein
MEAADASRDVSCQGRRIQEDREHMKTRRDAYLRKHNVRIGLFLRVRPDYGDPNWNTR